MREIIRLKIKRALQGSNVKRALTTTFNPKRRRDFSYG
jgi:hypothetical protein